MKEIARENQSQLEQLDNEMEEKQTDRWAERIEILWTTFR